MLPLYGVDLANALRVTVGGTRGKAIGKLVALP
jgi:hypothetical protein